MKAPLAAEGNSPAARHARRLRMWWLLPSLVLMVIAIILIAMKLQSGRIASQLLTALPDTVPADAALLRFASAQAKPLYASYCAACHGADMRGNSALGAPDLTDRVWLYGSGSVYDIERTLLYGIRSGYGKTRDVTDMPGFGLRGALSANQVHSVVEYLLKLNGRPYQVGAADQGHALYFDPQVNCGDCHGGDAHGNPDYGAPDLTLNVWNNGGDPQSLYDSIYSGRHRIMPAWIGTLSLEQVRALAVYVYAVSHRVAIGAAPVTAASATP